MIQIDANDIKLVDDQVRIQIPESGKFYQISKMQMLIAMGIKEKIVRLQKQMQNRCGSADIEYCKVYCDKYSICRE